MNKKVALSVVAALAFAAAPAFAADMPVKAKKVAVVETPSPFDIAFGGGIMSDYVWRGVTQSGHKPSVTAYFEPRYNIDANWQLYAGISGESIKFANNAAAEIDFYGGVRPTFGPIAFDVGAWYYYYPGGTCYAGTAACPSTIPNGNVAKSVASFYEVYGKVTYTIGDFALEVQMDKLARLIGMDPFEFRFVNAYRDGDMKAHRQTTEGAALIEVMQEASRAADWPVADKFYAMSSYKKES